MQTGPVQVQEAESKLQRAGGDLEQVLAGGARAAPELPAPMDLSANRQTTRTLETDKALELLQAMEARHEDQVRRNHNLYL